MNCSGIDSLKIAILLVALSVFTADAQDILQLVPREQMCLF